MTVLAGGENGLVVRMGCARIRGVYVMKPHSSCSTWVVRCSLSVARDMLVLTAGSTLYGMEHLWAVCGRTIEDHRAGADPGVGLGGCNPLFFRRSQGNSTEHERSHALSFQPSWKFQEYTGNDCSIPASRQDQHIASYT